jgi:hypothetical protein
MVSAGHQQSGSSKASGWSSLKCDTSVLLRLVSHLCDLSTQVQCAYRAAAATANTRTVSVGHQQPSWLRSSPGHQMNVTSKLVISVIIVT